MTSEPNKPRTPFQIDESVSSENLKKGLSSGNLQTALSPAPKTTEQPAPQPTKENKQD